MTEFGALMFPTDYAIRPAALAKAIEEREMDSLFFPEHTHIPVSRKTPFPGGNELPKEYSKHMTCLSPWQLRCGDKRIKLGTGICLL